MNNSGYSDGNSEAERAPVCPIFIYFFNILDINGKIVLKTLPGSLTSV